MSDTTDSGKTRNFVGDRENPLRIINYNDFENFSKQFPNLLDDKSIAVALIVNFLRKSIAGSSMIKNLWETGISEITELADNPIDAYYEVISILNTFEDRHVTTIPSSVNMPIENRSIPNERMRMGTEEDKKLIFKLFETFEKEGYVGVLYEIIDLEQSTSPQSQFA